MLLRGPEELGRPVRPAHYVASADSPTFTKVRRRAPPARDTT